MFWFFELIFLYITVQVPSADVKFVVLDEKKEIQVCWIIKASVLPS